MTQLFVRMYGTEAQARQVSDALKARGYQQVFMFSALAADEGQSQATAEELAEQIAKAHVVKAEAKIYAERVAKGSALVVVYSPFTSGLAAKTILDAGKPIDSGVPEPQYEDYTWDMRYPLSSAFYLKLLSKNALPAERLFGLPSLTRRPFFFSDLFGFALLSRSTTPFSNKTGFATLSKSGTPFSSKLGLPLLSK